MVAEEKASSMRSLGEADPQLPVAWVHLWNQGYRRIMFLSRDGDIALLAYPLAYALTKAKLVECIMVGLLGAGAGSGCWGC